MKQYSLKQSITLRLFFVISPILWFLNSDAMEIQDSEKSFKVFFIKNECQYGLNCLVQDDCGQSVIDMVFADMPNETIKKEKLFNSKHANFVLEPKKTASIILFDDIEEHKKLKFPLDFSSNGLLSFKINDNDDRKSFSIEQRAVANNTYLLGLVAYVKDLKNKTVKMRSHQLRDGYSNTMWFEYDEKNDQLRDLAEDFQRSHRQESIRY